MKLQGPVPISVATPAKITPLLRVMARRPDGYHEVRLVLVPVSLYDTLTLDAGSQLGIALTVTGAEALGPVQDNLVHRAATRFHEAWGHAPRITLHLVKRIPAGAGLGGGSGNAAATLRLLNRAHGEPLAAATLRELAAGLGSDVPFFLEPRPSWGSGRGEALEPLAGFPSLPLLVVKPKLGIATGDAYGACRPDPTLVERPLLETAEAVLRHLHNDFETVLLPRYPELAAIKGRLEALGAAGTLLSGTGSAVFGVFRDTRSRDAAANAMEGTDGWQIYPCRTLQRHCYFATGDGP